MKGRMTCPARVAARIFSSDTLVVLVTFLAFSSPIDSLVLRAKEASPSHAEESINLPKMTVKGTPVCSFGIGIVCTRDPATRKIRRVFISEVLLGSRAEQDGLKEGDEILALNGRKVAGLEADVKHGAWLFDQLVDREPGESIDVEVAVRVVKKVTLRASRATAVKPAN